MVNKTNIYKVVWVKYPSMRRYKDDWYMSELSFNNFLKDNPNLKLEKEENGFQYYGNKTIETGARLKVQKLIMWED